ncbi:MAG TPA: hypothetical protein VN201_00945, partial [Roseateles sp.]|nr:hypothetical protein [Roseateles sp.]
AVEAATQAPAVKAEPVAWWPEFKNADGEWVPATARPNETEAQARSVVANYPEFTMRIAALYAGSYVPVQGSQS